MELDLIVNLSDREQKRKLLVQIGAAQGPHQITMNPWKPRRSSSHNAWYFKNVVGALLAYLKAQGEVCEPEQAHDMIARAVNGEKLIMNPETGEVIGTIRKPTRKKDKSEFCEYIDRAIAWLGQMGIEVPIFERTL